MIIDFPGGARVDAHFGPYTVKTDQSPAGGGEGTAPTPFAIFLSSMGTCAGIYVKSFCDQRGIRAEGIKIIQSVVFDPEKRVPSTIKLDIQLPADFPEKYKAAVINAAELCLVKKTINSMPEFQVVTSTE